MLNFKYGRLSDFVAEFIFRLAKSSLDEESEVRAIVSAEEEDEDVVDEAGELRSLVLSIFA